MKTKADSVFEITKLISLQVTLLFSHSVVSNSLPPHGQYTPGFPVLLYLPEFGQICSHQVAKVLEFKL